MLRITKLKCRKQKTVCSVYSSPMQNYHYTSTIYDIDKKLSKTSHKKILFLSENSSSKFYDILINFFIDNSCNIQTNFLLHNLDANLNKIDMKWYCLRWDQFILCIDFMWQINYQSTHIVIQTIIRNKCWRIALTLYRWLLFHPL